MIVRKAVAEDISEIMEIYAHAREFMAAHGNPNQWGPTNWPPLELVVDDIRTGRSYVCEHEVRTEQSSLRAHENHTGQTDLSEHENRQGHADLRAHETRIIAVFFFDHGRDIEPTYRNIESGHWIGDDEYGVVHRIASDGSVKGVGKFCINWAYEQCGHLRMDTHGDNTIMQNLLTELGFQKCGIIYVVEDDYPRYAYEKL